MALANSFKFVDADLNRKLIKRLKSSGIKHVVDKEGVIHYAPRDEQVVENDLISAVRDGLFPSWQIVSCPDDWTENYRAYMTAHGIPFVEELIDGQLCFLIPRRYRPDAWQIDQPAARAVRTGR